MKQVTWRAPEDLVEAIREIARQQGRSLNEYLTQLAQAATDPDLAEDDAGRLRERLARAGLLAPSGAPVRRPDRDAVARARQDAARGTPLSDLVGDSRR